MSVTTSGLQLNVRQRAVRSAVELLSSMRFAISLLVILATKAAMTDAAADR